jgi:hypothetical protein
MEWGARYLVGCLLAKQNGRSSRWYVEVSWCPSELSLSKFPYCLVWRDVPLTSLVRFGLVWAGWEGGGFGGEGGLGPLPPTVPECTTSPSFLMNEEIIVCH